MRRRFNHNQHLLKELYGRNFSLKSLLSEDLDLNAIGKRLDKWNGSVGDERENLTKQLEKDLDDLVTAMDAGEFDGDSTKQSTAQGLRKTLDREFSDPPSTQKKKGEEETSSATKQGNKPQQKKTSSGNSQVKELQELIGHKPANGIWSGTDKTWSAWVDANKSKVPVQGIDIELVKTSWKKAAAQTNGQYAGNISGMLEFAKDMKEVSDNQGEKSKDEKTTSDISREDLVKSYEPLWKIASKPGYEWNGITDKESLKRTMRSLKGDRFMFIKNVDNTSDDKDANDDAIYFTISGHKDVSNIDKATISIEKMGPHIKILDTSFKSALEGSGVTLKQLMNADDKVIGHFPPTQPENANWTLNTKELFRIAVYGMMYKLNLNKDVIKESSYGKSRGQLYRERYFGRY